MKRIYFDYAATTPIDLAVKKAMMPYFSCSPSANWRSRFGNPGSLHSFGQEAMAAVDFSRETIAKSIGADFREIIFTGSATESNNLALRGIFNGLIQNLKIKNQNDNSKFKINKSLSFIPRIIVSSIEHESILETAKDLAENESVEIIYLPVNKNGIVNLGKLKNSLNERTILVSVMYANNEIGTIQPISAIADEISKWKLENRNNKKLPITNYPARLASQGEAGGQFPLFHTDAVQAFQYLDCDIQKLGVDFMTLSAHKIYGPKGIGVLYARNWKLVNSNLKNRKQLNYQLPITNYFSPIITGGGQEFGFRSGTENVPAIVGFAKAIKVADKLREKESRRIGDLRNYFWKELKKIYPKTELNPGVKNQSPITNYQLPNILNIYFPNNFSEDLLIKLNMAGIAVSAGSACTARATKFSHVLTVLGLPKERIRGSIRFSFGRFTTKSELVETLKRLKNLNFA